MKIEVFDQATSAPIGEFEMDAVPNVGELLAFSFDHSRLDRYRVVEVEHQLQVSMVGDVVLHVQTTHTKTVVLVEPAEV